MNLTTKSVEYYEQGTRREKTKAGEGLFLEWGVSDGQSTAIILLKGGALKNVLVENIKFIERKE